MCTRVSKIIQEEVDVCTLKYVCLYIRDAYEHVWESLEGVHVCLPAVGERCRPAVMRQAWVVGQGAKSPHCS